MKNTLVGNFHLQRGLHEFINNDYNAGIHSFANILRTCRRNIAPNWWMQMPARVELSI